MLLGRAAEWLVFEELSTGAADDLAKATDVARGMVMRYGMDEGLRSVSSEDERPTFLNPAEPQPAGRRVSEATARRIDAAVQAIIARAFDRATDVLTENRTALEAAAARLLEKETLEQDELRTIAEPLRRRPARAETIRSA
ncbi:Cell division protein FtsH [Caenispirillum salinarum AK4]|uniref:Cell division protein FtsH n=1 Tax=Caenispirillum salinarum AK4 TaxID=1238182 RepID=K9HEG6_9PROT|nr:cell division protein FtsH [Caenispirillum salinarum]EKV28893.1 Cell division protein FtsH [Caenispirillum salinarum AK4]